MSLFTLRYDPNIGPIVYIGVHFPASMYPAESDPTTRPFKLVPMLVDTGASMTCLATTAAEELGLPVLGQRPMRSTTHAQPANVYLGDFFLSVEGITPIFITDVRYVDFPQGNDAVMGLLGRDLLGGSLVQVNGKDGTITIAF